MKTITKSQLKGIQAIPSKTNPKFNGYHKHEGWTFVTDGYCAYATQEIDALPDLEEQDNLELGPLLKQKKRTKKHFKLNRKLLIKLLKAYKSEHVEFYINEDDLVHPVFLDGVEAEETGMIMPYL